MVARQLAQSPGHRLVVPLGEDLLCALHVDIAIHMDKQLEQRLPRAVITFQQLVGLVRGKQPVLDHLFVRVSSGQTSVHLQALLRQVRGLRPVARGLPLQTALFPVFLQAAVEAAAVAPQVIGQDGVELQRSNVFLDG